MARKNAPSPRRVEELRAQVRQHPDSARAHYNLGTALIKRGKVAEAESELRNAVELDPRLVGAWVNLGGVLLTKWDFEGCIAANARAIEAEPNELLAHYNKGLGHLYLKQPEETLGCFLRVLDLDPEHPAGHYYAAVAYLACEKVPEARAHLAMATARGYKAPPDFMRAISKAEDGDVAVMELVGNAPTANAETE